VRGSWSRRSSDKYRSFSSQRVLQRLADPPITDNDTPNPTIEGFLRAENFAFHAALRPLKRRFKLVCVHLPDEAGFIREAAIQAAHIAEDDEFICAKGAGNSRRRAVTIDVEQAIIALRHRRQHRHKTGLKQLAKPLAVDAGNRAAVIVAHDAHAPGNDCADGVFARTPDRGFCSGQADGVDASGAEPFDYLLVGDLRGPDKDVAG